MEFIGPINGLASGTKKDSTGSFVHPGLKSQNSVAIVVEGSFCCVVDFVREIMLHSLHRKARLFELYFEFFFML